jgi:hypothetical protein
MSTDTLTRQSRDTRSDEQTSTGSGIVAHIVRDRAKITEAYVLGTPLEALCGHVWVPSRDPKRYPTCGPCSDIAERLWGCFPPHE